MVAVIVFLSMLCVVLAIALRVVWGALTMSAQRCEILHTQLSRRELALEMARDELAMMQRRYGGGLCIDRSAMGAQQ
ncbi:MAG: hypothetical protein E6Q97_00020 [Desulfurellales bacterium]|nr:MAG: hypothetical protein E6Q97_00020 [Desulfurellales bacterium]